MEASFIEVYKKTLRDLLASPGTGGDVKLIEGKKGETYLLNPYPHTRNITRGGR